MNAQRGVVVVAGMHRAGTSVVARGLQALGLDLGDALMSADVRQNARGFFEDVDVVKLDDALLDQAGADWKNVALLDAVDWSDAAHAPSHEIARKLLERKVAPSGRFAFKDPRIARVLPFWQRVFADLALDDAYVIAVRHPQAVIDSLSARDGLDPRRSALLWLTHFLCAMRYTNGRKRVIVDYDRLLEAPSHELARTARALGVPETAGERDLAAYASDFLSRELRHAAYAPQDLSSAAFTPEIAAAHDLAQRLARDEADPAAEATIAAIDAQFAALRALSPFLAYAGAVERAADEVPRLEAELAWTRKSLDTAIRYSEDLQATLARKDGELREAAAYIATDLKRIEDELRAAHAVFEKLRANPAGRLLLHHAKRSR
jgi:hypothetical protein